DPLRPHAVAATEREDVAARQSFAKPMAPDVPGLRRLPIPGAASLLAVLRKSNAGAGAGLTWKLPHSLAGGGVPEPKSGPGIVMTSRQQESVRRVSQADRPFGLTHEPQGLTRAGSGNRRLSQWPRPALGAERVAPATSDENLRLLGIEEANRDVLRKVWVGLQELSGPRVPHLDAPIHS